MTEKENKPTATEKLDAVLIWLFENKDELDCFYGYGLTMTYSNPKEMTLTRREVTNILNKLYADGYLNLKMQGTEGISVDVEHYSINFNGEVLLQKGGYTQELKNEKTKIRHIKIKDNLLLFFTFLTAAATLGIFLMGFREILCR